MTRIARITGSFVAVVVAYWAYALMAAILIDPPPPKVPAGVTSANGSGGDVGTDILKLQIDAIRPLFNAKDWELDPVRTKVIESESAKLLFKDYDTTQGTGIVVLTPCTMIFSNGPTIEEAIVLQAPRAVLQFDHDLDLKQLSAANPKGGRLDGEIVIHSNGKKPGSEDDLRIVTKNVKLNQHDISTPEQVTFNWGPHSGSGRDMNIKLMPGKSGANGLDVAGIASFELRHIDRLHLEMGAETEKLLAAPSKTVEQGTGPIGAQHPPGRSGQLDLSPIPSPTTPIEIGCSGPFQFDVTRRVATFHDNVQVVKVNPAGEPDQIACDLLALWFIERPKGDGKAKTSDSLDLAPERLEAIGSPVVVTAPSQNATARAKRIEYNLATKSITLDGDQPVLLQQGPNAISARSLYYEPAAEEGRLGQLVAQGPGWLRGQSPDQPKQQLEAVWREQLRIQPREQYKEISLTGGAELKSPGVGQLQARKIFFWLTETPMPNESKKFDRQPHGLSASEDVCFGSPQISGKVQELEVWFEKAATNPSLAAASTPRSETAGGLSPIGSSNGVASNGAAVQLPLQRAGNLQPAGNLAAAGNPDVQRLPPAQQHFEVTGRKLRARVLQGGTATALTDLTIEDNVQVLETQTSQPGEQPALVRGDRLVAVNANAPNAAATVVGRPAHFEARGLELNGATLKVTRGKGEKVHVTVDGPGQMDLTTPNDLDGKPLPAPCKLTVTWQRGMNFNGQTAHFEQSVVASTPGMFWKDKDKNKDMVTQFRMDTNSMDVQLQRPVSFSDSKKNDNPQVEAIRCQGGVVMDSHTFDAQQRPVSHDHMEVTDLGINKLGGGITAGPGWINTVRYDSGDLLPGQPNAGGNAPAKGNQLFCLHVAFQKSMTGNIFLKWVSFRDHVKATYATPVDSWDAKVTTTDPSRLGPKGVVATCDELYVRQMILTFSDHPAIELYAMGNARVEGSEFTALGNKIMYSQAKEVLTLEGDGYAMAELLQQKCAGAPARRSTGQSFRYFLRAKNIEGDGVQTMETSLPGKR